MGCKYAGNIIEVLPKDGKYYKYNRTPNGCWPDRITVVVLHGTDHAVCPFGIAGLVCTTHTSFSWAAITYEEAVQRLVLHKKGQLAYEGKDSLL